MKNNLRYPSTRAEKRRAARELLSRAVTRRVQAEQAQRFSPLNRAQRRALAKDLGFSWQVAQQANRKINDKAA